MSADPRLPDFLIVGAMRSGTTYLSRHFRDHPDVFMGPNEIHFFDREESWRRGAGHYATFFEGRTTEKLIGEKTVAYSFRPGAEPPIAERIAQMLPEVKLLWSLRDPVERAYSNWAHAVKHGLEPRSFEGALRRGDRAKVYLRYRDRGVYVEQVREFLKHFPRERMHFTFFEDLVTRREESIAGVCEFLGIDPTARGPESDELADPLASRKRQALTNPVRLPRSRKAQWLANSLLGKAAPDLATRFRAWNRSDEYGYPPMKQETRRALSDFYRPYNEALAELLGVDLGRWT